MNIYSKTNTSIYAALKEKYRDSIIELGFLPPYFSSFSGILEGSKHQFFNICILGQEVVVDQAFHEAFRTYRNQCIRAKAMSFVFYHPRNHDLSVFMTGQVHTVSSNYIASEDLSETFIVNWFSECTDRTPTDLLDYHGNCPLLFLAETTCPLCDKKITVPAGITFGDFHKGFFHESSILDPHYAIKENFLPVTEFTDHIGGNVYYDQLYTGKFILYEDDQIDYSRPDFVTCPDCQTRIPLSPIVADFHFPDTFNQFYLLWQMELEEADIKVIREKGYPPEIRHCFWDLSAWTKKPGI